jgi:hypothetical protein
LVFRPFPEEDPYAHLVLGSEDHVRDRSIPVHVPVPARYQYVFLFVFSLVTVTSLK